VHFRDAPSLSPLGDMGSSASAAACMEASRCPICQDGLHNGSGVVTTLCNHDFHSKCLLDSPDSVCAVCRFSHEPCNPTKCAVCGSDEVEDLWMCATCGHTGCGRNKGGHAEGHFHENLDHHLVVGIRCKRVWDYKADKFILDPNFFPPDVTGEGFASQEEADEAYARQVGGKSLEQMSLNSKLEAIGTEYNYVLVSSLESQKQ
jgi:BRCA1-associated protein